ncbi:PREDICTED: transcription factor MYB34-like isoform X2 [Ipomoea nil]|uniref:transcription factor MYB34-like isoform X2 n=1 Tax=Ipomoea nil TaxID=35883 RepID=UPI0009014105|nr:PREDICTED: transcription factor MYB34-like isoform X2 [Ipomoea nil]
MQNMKKKVSNGNGNSNEASKPKERHIVSWSQEEDDILREQIRLHGTENWTIIASKFKDKTTRQCRRRWFTYLNSDFKKGGWSPEEDVLLCEAQRIFGNRWTEIAKVVSGRTDNAVKNRFTTLCKKRAKNEALAKENNNSFINLNNKRVIFPGAGSPFKKLRRSHISDLPENCNSGEKSLVTCNAVNQLQRSPFSVLPNVGSSLPTNQNVSIKDSPTNGTFLKKDDPKILALMQQAELLSSLALKVNSENSHQSLENAWKVLQDFLNQKEDDVLKGRISEMDFKGLAEDLKNINVPSQSWRQPALSEDSAGSSEYSSESTLLSHAPGDKKEQCEAEVSALHQDIESGLQSTEIGDRTTINAFSGGTPANATCTEADILPTCDKVGANEEAAAEECSSPLHVTPLFRTLAAAIPSPKFSESERQFLLKTLGMDCTSPKSSINNTSHPPSCKRVLLHSL